MHDKQHVLWTVIQTFTFDKMNFVSPDMTFMVILAWIIE